MICSNVSPECLGGIDRAAADLHELGARAAKRGLRVGFEALAWGRHINDYRDAWEAVRRADHPAVGLVLDSFHTLVRKTDLSAIRSIPRDRIVLVQLADAPLLDMDFLNWSRHYRNFPGQGELPLHAFMDALQATGFDEGNATGRTAAFAADQFAGEQAQLDSGLSIWTCKRQFACRMLWHQR